MSSRFVAYIHSRRCELFLILKGVWPAFWTFGQSGIWPAGGEIDIIEGVHDNIHNQVAFHTEPGCMYTPSGNYTGTPKVRHLPTFVDVYN
jgi:hypothetical protein